MNRIINFFKINSITICLILFLIFTFNFTLQASTPYKNYNYSFWEEAVPAPQAYLPSDIIIGPAIGVSDLDNPEDIFIRDEQIYIVDTGNDRIVITDKKFELLQVIEYFENNGELDYFDSPEGVFVTEAHHIYVADTDNRRLVELDAEGKLVRIIENPRETQEDYLEGVLPEELIYRPIQVVVDNAQRIYVVVEDAYQGLFRFDSDGVFTGFIGAPHVSPNPIDILWRQIATEEQRARMALYLPTNFNNINIDDEGFIYATIGGEARGDSVRRLNPSGEDGLRRYSIFPPIGDNIITSSEPQHEQDGIEYTEYIDVIPRSNGCYSVLSNNSGRVFNYSRNSDLLYVFGTEGNVKGTFDDAVALEELNEKMIVLDRGLNQLIVFEPTSYGRGIHRALAYYEEGFYENARREWEQLLKRNINFDLAYTNIGRALYRNDQFEEAMQYFRRGQARGEYSDAFSYYRQEVVQEYFREIVLLFMLSVILWVIIIKYNILTKITSKGKWPGSKSTDVLVNREVQIDSKKEWVLYKIGNLYNKLCYALHVIVHPFDGFWNLKREGRGNVISGTIILIVTIMSYIFMRQYTGFVFNTVNQFEINIYNDIFSILVPIVLWCGVNWAFTTLMDGKGTVKDIYISTTYSLTPFILLTVPMTVISNYLTLQEGWFYYFFLSVGLFWTIVLIFLGNLVTHDYTVSRGLIATILTIIGMGTALFIGFLFFLLISLVMNFGEEIYNEVFLRY